MNPKGAAVIIVNPPRVVMGDPQPGLHNHMSANAPRAASEQNRPIRPRPLFACVSGAAWITGGSSMLSFLELRRRRLAHRRDRPQVELDVDGNFLAD
jgi:hypothetical protein